jgi:hypothetical protein
VEVSSNTMPFGPVFGRLAADVASPSLAMHPPRAGSPRHLGGAKRQKCQCAANSARRGQNVPEQKLVDYWPGRSLVFPTAPRARLRCPLKSSMTKAILSDSQFWAPVVVLAVGIALLVYLH